jgi:hypothetical protein
MAPAALRAQLREMTRGLWHSGQVGWIEEKCIKAPWKKDKKPGAGTCAARQAHHHDLDGRPVSAQVGDMWLKKSGLQLAGLRLVAFLQMLLSVSQSDA